MLPMLTTMGIFFFSASLREVMVDVVAAADAAAGLSTRRTTALTCSSFMAVSIARLTKPSSLSRMIALDRQDDDLVLGDLLVRDEFLLHPRSAVRQQAAADGQQDEIQEERPADQAARKT